MMAARSLTFRCLVWAGLAALSACAAPGTQAPSGPRPTPPGAANYAPVPGPAPAVSPVNLQSLPQTIGLEHQDRVNRFARLSGIYGIQPPRIDQMQLSAGQVPGFDYPIPVVRIIFDERVFFDFDKDAVRPEASRVLDVMAENMKRDVPDARLTVLGHTDAIGSDAYNIDLSRRRAASVMAELVARGVRPTMLSTVAIGKRQPIAPNDNEQGRALNRRVEFMISASQAANVKLVEKRRVIEEYLKVKASDVPDAAPLAKVEILTLAPPDPAAPQPVAPAPTAAPVAPVKLQTAGVVDIQKPAPLDIKVNKPTDYQLNSINNEFSVF